MPKGPGPLHSLELTTLALMRTPLDPMFLKLAQEPCFTEALLFTVNVSFALACVVIDMLLVFYQQHKKAVDIPP